MILGYIRLLIILFNFLIIFLMLWKDIFVLKLLIVVIFLLSFLCYESWPAWIKGSVLITKIWYWGNVFLKRDYFFYFVGDWIFSLIKTGNFPLVTSSLLICTDDILLGLFLYNFHKFLRFLTKLTLIFLEIVFFITLKRIEKIISFGVSKWFFGLILKCTILDFVDEKSCVTLLKIMVGVRLTFHLVLNRRKLYSFLSIKLCAICANHKLI